MQDLAAVAFLAISTGKMPSYWALSLLLLLPLRPLLHRLLTRAGHGELLILYALVLALGGAEIFEFGGIKDDLGALIMGILISTHPKSEEMAKALLGFKDLFLVGFFLSIGISGVLSAETIIIGILLVPFIAIKSSLFFLLMTRFKLRARTSLFATINLSNYSEFGLIVTAIGVSNNWLSAEWLVIIAVAVSVSFIVSATLSSADNRIYNQLSNFWLKFQSKERLPDDRIITIHDETIAIFGMGRVGSGAYDKMHELYGDTVVGFDSDATIIKQHQQKKRKVIYGDPGDADFWEKVDSDHSIELVMLALPKFAGQVTTIARYPDEVEILEREGATAVFDIYSEAGAGFAEHIHETVPISH